MTPVIAIVLYAGMSLTVAGLLAVFGSRLLRGEAETKGLDLDDPEQRRRWDALQ
jgi:hypothetical protein